MASSVQLSFADMEGMPEPPSGSRRTRSDRPTSPSPLASTETAGSRHLQLALELPRPATVPSPDARLNLAEWQAIMQAPMRNKRYRLTNGGDAVFDYLTWKEIEDGAAPRTLDQYERDLSRLCLAHPAVPAERLTADQYRSVIASFPAGSRRRATAVFRDFSRWLYQEGRSDEDAMGRVRYPRSKRQTLIDVFSDDECARLVRQPDRDRPLVRILLEAGLRKSEARRLRLRHLDVEQGRLRVIEGKGRKDRLIPLPPALVDEILALALGEGLGPGDHLWYATKANQFGEACLHRERPIGEATFARWWRACCERAGVAYRSPHVCRHTFATRWLRDGGRLETLARALGHESIRTTNDLYAHLATEDVATDLSRVLAARERRLRDQSAPQTPAQSGSEARTGFEPVYEALQASA
jgi:integrase